MSLSFYHFIVSDWVARVPGLYWADNSSIIRKHTEEEIAVKSLDWEELHPPGKSKKVIGGIGTIKLPPNDEGKKIMSISSSCNASLGIPILIFPEVYESLRLEEGDLINIKDAKWQPLSASWSKRFSTTKNIPRGYLIIDKPSKIEIIKKGIPIVYHPFTIMEYESQDALLYDFVFMSIDSKVNDARKQAEKFFDGYKKKNNRNGTYLLNPDIVSPLFEAQYNSPQEMKGSSEKAKIDLLYKRIYIKNFDKTTLDTIIHLVPKFYESSMAIKKLAKELGISVAFLQEDNAASMSAQLINQLVEKGKIEELIDRMTKQYPEILEQ